MAGCLLNKEIIVHKSTNNFSKKEYVAMDLHESSCLNFYPRSDL